MPAALARRPPAILIVVLAAALTVAAAGAPAQKQAPRAQKKQPEKEKRKAAGPPRLDARAWILVDALDGEVLAGRARERELPIASATKLMTAHLALRRLKPRQTLRAPAYNGLAIESKIGLRAGEMMTVRDLLYALLLESANDAAATFAAGVSGKEKRFVAEMNRAARRLGLRHTSYANPIGFDAPGNYSSAQDLVTLADRLLEHRLFARIVDTPRVVLKSGDRPREISTRNTLLLKRPWVVGVKTGHTIGAGWVLVGAGRRNGTTLISAVLGAPSEAARDAGTLKLLDYGFSLYRARSPVSQGQELADPKLAHRDERLPLVARKEVRASVRRGQAIATRIEAPDEVDGPIEQGETLGQVVVLVDGRVAGSSALVASRPASAATTLQKAIATVNEPRILLPAGLFVIVVVLLLARRARRGQAEPGERRDPRERTPEERRRMHDERMQRRRERSP